MNMESDNSTYKYLCISNISKWYKAGIKVEEKKTREESS